MIKWLTSAILRRPEIFLATLTLAASIFVPYYIYQSARRDELEAASPRIMVYLTNFHDWSERELVIVNDGKKVAYDVDFQFDPDPRLKWIEGVGENKSLTDAVSGIGDLVPGQRKTFKLVSLSSDSTEKILTQIVSTYVTYKDAENKSHFRRFKLNFAGC